MAIDTLERSSTSEIKDTIIDAIGNTPLVRLHKTARSVRPEQGSHWAGHDRGG